MKKRTLSYWPYCASCEKPFEFDLNEPFAYCDCGTTEWSDPRPADFVSNPRFTMDAISKANVERALIWHQGGLSEWSLLEWAGAMCGEAGETANVAKKIKRVDQGLRSTKNLPRAELIEKLMREIGDTYLYLDLLARTAGLSIGDCVVITFNEVSIREDFPQRI